MGKILLILVLTTTLSGTLYLSQLQRGANEQGRRHAERSYERLAEDVAQSGYALGGQRLHDSFAPFSEDATTYGPGTFDLQATQTSDGTLTLRSTGNAGPARFAIEGEYARLARPCDLLGALFLHSQLSPAVAITGTGFTIRGEDTRPPSRTGGSAIVDGPGYTVAGILADTLVSESFETPIAGLGTLSAEITVGGVTDEGYLRDLVGCALTLAAETIDGVSSTTAGSRTWVGRTFGSPVAPAMVVVEDDVTLKGSSRGYGLLLAGGNVTLEEDAVWEGLILSVGRGASVVTVADSARVYGGVLGAGVPLALLTGLYSGFSPLGAVAPYLDATGAVVGSLGLYRRPMGLVMSDRAGIYASEEAMGHVAALLASVEEESRVVVLNERFGMATGG